MTMNGESIEENKEDSIINQPNEGLDENSQTPMTRDHVTTTNRNGKELLKRYLSKEVLLVLLTGIFSAGPALYIAKLNQDSQINQSRLDRQINAIKDYSAALNKETFDLLNKVRLRIKENETLQRKVSLENKIPYNEVVKAFTNAIEITAERNHMISTMNTQRIIMGAVYTKKFKEIALEEFTGPLFNMTTEKVYRDTLEHQTAQKKSDKEFRQDLLIGLNAMHILLRGFEEQIIEDYKEGVKDIVTLINKITP